MDRQDALYGQMGRLHLVRKYLAWANAQVDECLGAYALDETRSEFAALRRSLGAQWAVAGVMIERIVEELGIPESR